MKKFAWILLLFSKPCMAQPSCDEIKPPIVFVHGFLASGDTWATQIQRFSSNGYCDDRMFVFDWNTIGGKQKPDSLLDMFVSKVLQRTGAAKIDLVAHSAGGGLCYGYLKDSARSARVAHYIHIGSGKIKQPAGYNGNVSTLNIYSTDDLVVKGGADVPGATNLKETGKDHLQVASSEESFAAMYRFLNDNREPAMVTIMTDKSPNRLISGRAVILGENGPLVNDSILVYSFNPKTGRRTGREPFKRMVTDSSGYWPAFEVGKKTFLEFEVQPRQARVISYYIEPTHRKNAHIYLRCLPSSGMLGGMLRALPEDDKQSAIVIFSANNAVVSGRDQLSIDSISLSTDTLTPASKTIIATFLYDDGDGISSGKVMKSFGPGIFLNAVDVMTKADNHSTTEIIYNGRRMRLPCRPSKEVIQVAVFN